jgi:hypothetical protein
MSGTKYMLKSCHDAERAASVCPECEHAGTHAQDCVLRPMHRYEDYLRDFRAYRPEEYWGKYAGYLTDP